MARRHTPPRPPSDLEPSLIRALTTKRPEMTPFLLLTPALITMLFVVALPLVFSLWTSLTPYQLTKPQTI